MYVITTIFYVLRIKDKIGIKAIFAIPARVAVACRSQHFRWLSRTAASVAVAASA